MDGLLYQHTPEPPEVLDETGKVEWVRVCNELYKRGLLNDIDLSLLTAYCMEISTYYECKRIIQQKSYIYPIKDEDGKVKYLQQIPHVGIGNKALLNAIKLAKNFFITPGARVKLSAFNETKKKKGFNTDMEIKRSA